MTRFQVNRVKPQVWNGRYARIPGDTTVMHVHFVDGKWRPVCIWELDGVKAVCSMVDSKDAIVLAKAVNKAKKFLGGGPGGSFLINERGQILVPAPGSKDFRRAIAGTCSGPLLFANSLKGYGTFDLADDTGLKLGDVWDRPYIGMIHHLSNKNQLYFWKVDADGGTKVLPQTQDTDLIAALRHLRPFGGVKFIAAYGGLILTKVPVGIGAKMIWEPRYVGRINFDEWFQKEN